MDEIVTKLKIVLTEEAYNIGRKTWPPETAEEIYLNLEIPDGTKIK